MENLLRTNLYTYVSKLDNNDYVNEYLKIEIAALKNIENLFYFENINKTLSEYSSDIIINTIKENNKNNNLLLNEHNADKKLNGAEKIVSRINLYLDKLQNNVATSDNLSMLFYKYLKCLIVRKEIIFEKEKLRTNFPYKSQMPKVFLSHAYDDNLYAYGLFRYFYDNGIYLYVDWMHNDSMENGKDIKKTLSAELKNCDQLLYLLTPNSELNIDNNYYIRPWCSWETGHFYLKKSNQKYFINLYSSNLHKIKQIQGMKQLTNHNKQGLVGTTFLF